MTGWLSRYSSDGDQANTEALRISKPEDKGLFEGGLKATGEGVARGGVAVGRAAQLAGSTIPLFQDALWGLDPNAENSAYREYMDVTDPWLKPAEDAYQIDENAGAGAQVLGGLGRIVLPLMVGGGNPAPLVASETTIGAQDALKQGATSEQAVGIGIAQGAVAGLGFKIPAAIGKTAATKVASGAAINVGLGAGLRGVQSTIAGDNEKFAEMYDPFDPTYVMTDLAIGASFGAIAAIAGKRRAAPLDQQDVIADAEIQQQTQASAPVTPDSPNTANRHAQNLDAAEQALKTGQPVSAKPIVRPREPSAEIESMPVDERKALKYNSPQLDAYAAHVEQKYGLPDGVLVAIKNSGERSNSDQVSPAGAQGVMQFIPSTWKAYGKGLDPTDPVHSIDAAGRFWADLIKQYDGNVLAAAAHYNGGTKQGKLVASGKRPSNAETAGYVDRIERHLGAMGKDVPMPPRVDESVVIDGAPPIVQAMPDATQPTPDLFGDPQPRADAQPIAPVDVAPPVRSVMGGDITLSTGLPFDTVRDARKAIKSQKLGDGYSVQEVDGGYVVRKVEQPQPIEQPAPQGTPKAEPTPKVELTADNPVVTITPDDNASQRTPNSQATPSKKTKADVRQSTVDQTTIKSNAITNAAGRPFASIKDAQKTMQSKKLKREDYVFEKSGDGFIIRDRKASANDFTKENSAKLDLQPEDLMVANQIGVSKEEILFLKQQLINAVNDPNVVDTATIIGKTSKEYNAILDSMFSATSNGLMVRRLKFAYGDGAGWASKIGMVISDDATMELTLKNKNGRMVVDLSQEVYGNPAFASFTFDLQGMRAATEKLFEPVRNRSKAPIIENQKPIAGKNEQSAETTEQQAALSVPDDLRIPTGELDADGNPITMTAKEMREQLAAEKAAIDEQTKANDAAITCALGFGE